MSALAFAGTGVSFESTFWDRQTETQESQNQIFEKANKTMAYSTTSVNGIGVSVEPVQIKPYTLNRYLHTPNGVPYQLFHAYYSTKPLLGLKLIKEWVELSFLDKGDATDWLFPALLRARGDQFEYAYSTIVEVCSPSSVLKYSLKKYREGWGETYLQYAVSILSDSKEDISSALKTFLVEDQPEAEFFAGLIASDRRFSTSERKAILLKLLHSRFTGNRIAALEAVKSENLAFKNEFAAKLISDPEGEVKALAQMIIR